MRVFAERLLACETSANNRASGSDLPAIFRVCEKLRINLGGFMGNAGFRALVSRSLVLSDPEVPWLRAARTKPDGSLDGQDEIIATVHARELAQGGVVLVAQLLGMLVALIGEHLTLRLMHEAWPKLSLEDFAVEKGDKNEKEK